jgi:hypothetical protein
MNDKQVNIWKEMVVACFKAPSGKSPRDAEKYGDNPHDSRCPSRFSRRVFSDNFSQEI